MNDLNKTLCFFIVMFVLAALIELFVLRRWSGRWSLEVCIVAGAVFSGIISVSIWMMVTGGNNTETEEPSSAMKVAIVLILSLVFMVAALIPAGVTAFIYRKLKKDLPVRSLPD